MSDKPRVFQVPLHYAANYLDSVCHMLCDSATDNPFLLITRSDEGAVVAADVVPRLRLLAEGMFPHSDSLVCAVLTEAVLAGLLPSPPPASPAQPEAKAQPEWPQTSVARSLDSYWHYRHLNDRGRYVRPGWGIDVEADIPSSCRQALNQPHLDGVPLDEIKRRHANGTLLDKSLKWDFVTPEAKPATLESLAAVIAIQREDIADAMNRLSALESKIERITP